MILECLEDCYMEDEKGNLTDKKSFTKGKLYQVINFHKETCMYSLRDDRERYNFISYSDKNFEIYYKNIYVIVFKTQGSVIVRAGSAREALKKIAIPEQEFSISKITHEVTEDGRLLKYS